MDLTMTDITQTISFNDTFSSTTEIMSPINPVSPLFYKNMLLANQIILQIIGIVATVMNTFNLIVYLTNKKLWSTPNVMLINLSVSDLLLGVACIAFVNIRHIDNVTIVKYLLTLTGSLQILALYMSSTCILIISLERWIAVTFPLFYKIRFTIKYAYGLVAITWLYGLAIGAVPFYYLLQLPTSEFRKPLALNAVIPHGFNIYLLQIHPLSACSASGMLYVSILVTMKIRAVNTQRRLAEEQSRKSTIIAGVVVSTVIACYIPNTILNVAAPSWLLTTWWGMVINFAAINLVFCNSFMNVFIYASRNDAFRKTYKTLFSIKSTVSRDSSTSQYHSSTSASMVTRE